MDLKPLTLLPLLAALPGLRAQAPPEPRLEFGFEERIRSEDWNNLTDHSEAKPDYRTQYRFRTRAWLQYTQGGDLEVMAGIVNENRRITSPGNAVFNGREVFFETLYLDYRFSPAFSVRVGRQNLMRGEGFILFDGNAGDGSRSQYFNAVNATWSWGKSRLELLAISNPLKDRYLPVGNEITHPAEMNRLTEWDEQALGLYYTGKEWTGTQVEAYAFYKTEKDFDLTNKKAPYQPDRRFTTLGGRLVKELGAGWTATGEASLQRGTQDAPVLGTGTSKDIQAWGGYARLKKAFDAAWKPSASLAYIALSGQDPGRTDRITAWNPVFSRWPKWSELYVYSQGPEKGVGYWSNTGMWELEARFAPTRDLDLRATWYRMSALEPVAASPGPIFGTGRTRGDLWQARVDYRLNPSFKAHALYEYLAPGSFYAGKDGGHFLRFEISYLFKHRL